MATTIEPSSNRCNGYVNFLCSYGGTKVIAGHFAQGVGDILLANVSCTGSESNVLECKHSLMTDHCTHSKDVAVKCKKYIILFILKIMKLMHLFNHILKCFVSRRRCRMQNALVCVCVCVVNKTNCNLIFS